VVSNGRRPPGVAALTRLRAARAGGVRLTDELPLLPAPYVHLAHYVYRSAWTCRAGGRRDSPELLGALGVAELEGDHDF